MGEKHRGDPISIFCVLVPTVYGGLKCRKSLNETSLSLSLSQGRITFPAASRILPLQVLLCQAFSYGLEQILNVRARFSLSRSYYLSPACGRLYTPEYYFVKLVGAFQSH